MAEREGFRSFCIKRGKMEKPRWEKFSDNAKKQFARNLLSNASIQNKFNRYSEWAENEPKNGYGTYGPADGPSDRGNGGPPLPPPPPPLAAGGTRGTGTTFLPTIPVLNLMAGAPPPLPVRLDADLPHIAFGVGGSSDANTGTKLVALVDSDAGATISWLPFFEAMVLINPSMLSKYKLARADHILPSPCMALSRRRMRIFLPASRPLSNSALRITAVMATIYTSWLPWE